MMPQQAGTFVIVDDQGVEHEFPAGMDPKRAAAIVRDGQGTQRQEPPAQPGLARQLAGQTGRMGAQVVRNTVDPARDVIGAAWDATRDPADAAERGAQWAMNLFSGMGQAQAAQLTKAQEAAAQGDYVSAVTHGGAYLLPVIGPMLDDMVSRVQRGESAEVAGDLFTMFVLPSLAKRVPNAPRLGGSSLGPKEAAATQWGVDQGLKLSAAETTGNPFLHGAEYLAERTSLSGSVIGPSRRGGMQDGLATLGEQLRAKTNAGRGPRSMLDAGEQLVEAMGPEGTVVTGFHATSKRLYERLKAFTDSDPKFMDAEFAVDMRAAQDRLRALAKSLEDSPEKLPLRGDLHHARAVLNDVLALDNTVPMMRAELDGISRLKEVQRGFKEGTSEWGVIEEAIQALDEQVIAAARRGGADIEGTLREARTAVAKMHDVMDDKDFNPKSDTGLVRKITAPEDDGIKVTRKVQEYAPEVLANVGRAAVEKVFAASIVKDGINKADSMLNRWQALGAETKKAVFAEAIAKDPNFLADMDKFMLVASRVGQKANSSNSGGVIAGGVHLSNLLFAQNIPAALLQETAGGIISLLSRNPRVVKMLTRGMQMPTNAIAAKTANTAAIYKALGLATAPARAQGAGPVGGR